MELEEADCTSSGVAHNSADRQGVSQEQLHSSANNRDGPAELTTGEGAELATEMGCRCAHQSPLSCCCVSYMVDFTRESVAI